MNTNQKIAKVQLGSRFRQLLVAILSVAFGTSMYIAMNSFMAGVNNIQTEITFASMAHIKVFNDLTDDTSSILSAPKENNTVLMVHNNKNIQYTEGIKNVDEIKKKIFEIPEVNSVTVQLNETVFIRNGVAKANARALGWQ